MTVLPGQQIFFKSVAHTSGTLFEQWGGLRLPALRTDPPPGSSRVVVRNELT